MRRTYRISLVIEGTFSRKVSAKREAERLLRSLRVREPWTKAMTRVTSKAAPERKAKEPRGPTAREAERARVLATARRIAGELRALAPSLPKVTVRWLSDGCAYTRSYGYGAHAHPGKWWAGRENGKRVRLPRNLICLVSPYDARYVATGQLDAFGHPEHKRVRVPYDEERMADLLAHEIMHMRFTKRTHRSKAFKESAEQLVERWKEWRTRRPDDARKGETAQAVVGYTPTGEKA